jgi:hypothetical protein
MKHKKIKFWCRVNGVSICCNHLVIQFQFLLLKVPITDEYITPYARLGRCYGSRNLANHHRVAGMSYCMPSCCLSCCSGPTWCSILYRAMDVARSCAVHIIRVEVGIDGRGLSSYGLIICDWFLNSVARTVPIRSVSSVLLP